MSKHGKQNLYIPIYIYISISIYLYISISMYWYLYIPVSLYLHISISLCLYVILYLYISISLSILSYLILSYPILSVYHLSMYVYVLATLSWLLYRAYHTGSILPSQVGTIILWADFIPAASSVVKPSWGSPRHGRRRSWRLGGGEMNFEAPKRYTMIYHIYILYYIYIYLYCLYYIIIHIYIFIHTLRQFNIAMEQFCIFFVGKFLNQTSSK